MRAAVLFALILVLHPGVQVQEFGLHAQEARPAVSSERAHPADDTHGGYDAQNAPGTTGSRGAEAFAGTATHADARAALALRIDSLLDVGARYQRLLHERDSARAAAVEVLAADTTVVGPFLFVNRGAPRPAAVAALQAAWERRAPLVGGAVTQLNGVIISTNLSARELNTGVPVHHYRPRVREGSPEFDDAAEQVVAAALVAAMPQDVQDWIGGGSLATPDAFLWAYRDLATSASIPARRCYALDMDACALAVVGDAASLMNPATRISLLQHALELGGNGAYARFIEAAPEIGSRLARAADHPLDEVMTGWRSAVQDARPRVHAGVARAGLWTLIWLAALGLLAMRSTRWRLG